MRYERLVMWNFNVCTYGHAPYVHCTYLFLIACTHTTCEDKQSIFNEKPKSKALPLALSNSSSRHLFILSIYWICLFIRAQTHTHTHTHSKRHFGSVDSVFVAAKL